MAIEKIVLLTGLVEAPVLTAMLSHANPTVAVQPVMTLAELARACEHPNGTRLISFCSSVIVPRDILESLKTPAYNFHPGPPERPGRYPSVFALYEGAPSFGITIHEMAAAVDSGPIVHAEWFDIPAACDLIALEELTLTKLAKVFHRLAPLLTHAAQPLPHLPVSWSGRKTTKADCDLLCAITPGMDEAEKIRRQRCCGSLSAA